MIEIVSDRHSGATRADRTIHRNAPLTVEGRRRLVDRCRTRPIAHVAAEMGISRATASKRVNRYKQFGDLGLLDRSSTPLRQFTATDGADTSTSIPRSTVTPGSPIPRPLTMKRERLRPDSLSARRLGSQRTAST